MPRYVGHVGYGLQQEISQGVWADIIVEGEYYGDVEKVTTRLRDGDGLNQDIVSEHKISVLADENALEFWNQVKYVEWAGLRWSVKSAQIIRPRLILYIGGVYNGPIAAPATPSDP